MTGDLELMAGGSGADTDAERQACLDAIETAIRPLLRQGMPAGTIVAALAIASVRLLDRQRRH